MVIRVLDEKRANYCDELLTKLIEDEKNYDSSLSDSFKVTNYFKNIIKNTNNYLLCYEENNTIKGYIFLKEIKDDNKNGYLIDGLYVLKEYRNNKIASSLIEESFKILKEKKIDFIDINVLSDNLVAINLYRKFGFQDFRITMRKTID